MTPLQSSLLRGSRAAPSPSSPGKPSRQDDAQLPEAYQQEHPPWRPPLHPAAADREVPDLFPTKPNQPEDDMSQISVRKGFAFSARPYVHNESCLAHDTIYTRLASPDKLHSLSSWMDEVMLRRRQLDRANLAPSQYKAPSRVTLNETKLANYVKDLADPNVPLTRLSRSVPHGFRGEKLFEMLWAGGALPPTAAANASYFASRNTAAPSSASTPNAASAAQRKSVDISRAVWFIRALGTAELSSLRNKSAATIIPEITSSLCSWMAKQVAELSLVHAAESSSTAAASPASVSPSTHLARTSAAASSSLSRSVAAAHFARTPSNLNPASSPSPAPAREVCSVLQNELDEERWTAKWSYSLSLARHLHAQHLLDRSTLVRWIVDAFAASNLVQLPFLLELVQEVFVFLLRRRCFVKPFLAALLVHIPTLDARLDRTVGGGLRAKLVLLFRIVCETCPDALVSPRLWSDHPITLTQLLHEISVDAEADTTLAAPAPFAEYVDHNVKPRVDRLLIHSRRHRLNEDSKIPKRGSIPHSLQQHIDIKALDSFDMKTLDRVFLHSIAGIHRPSKLNRDDALWAPRIETILTWACTDRRSGVARQYLAATLIEKIRFGVSWEETSEETDQVSLPAFDLDHHTKKTRKINVEPMLIKWLGDVEASLNQNQDASAEAQPRTSSLATVQVTSIVVLVGELARRGVFSYTKYLQRLIARGMTTASLGSTNPEESVGALASRDSLHLRLLRSLPLYDQPASVYQQRRQAIYGDRTKETYEDAAQRRALRQLQTFLPFVFTDEAQASVDARAASSVSLPPFDVEPRDPEQALSRLWSASRFVRCRIFRNHLLPAVSARIDTLDGEQLSRISALLVMADDFEGLAQLLATLLLRALSDGLARAAFNMVIEFSLVWRSMDIMGTLNQLVRQQLNHSSSVRNDRQAVMASTTLLRLRTLIEGIPSRIHAPLADAPPEPDAIQQHVQALRPNVDALLDRFAKLTRSSNEASVANVASAPTPTPAEGSDILTPFRNLFLHPDATSDEIIERTIVESVLERSSAHLIPAAVRLIDQLYLEASLEIDERHARWLAHLANSVEQGTHQESSMQALLGLLNRLVAHGTLNLQLAMDTFLLPYLLSSVRRLTDPATRGIETSSHLVAVVSSLGEMFASILCETRAAFSYEDMRAFGAQTMLLFAQINLPLLLRATTCLICASDEPSPVNATEKAKIEAFWRSLLRSEPMQIAFRQDPRLCMLTIRETCKSMWGCSPSRIMDLAMACLDPTSLLLRDVTSVDAASVKARLDGWDTAVVANELVEIFERLQLVESSFQSRADSKTKALASGIFDDLFVKLPDIGAQLVRDCQSSGLVSRFTDIGIKILSDKVKARTEAAKSAEEQLNTGKPVPMSDGLPQTGGSAEVEASTEREGTAASNPTASMGSSTGATETGKLSLDTEVESTLQSVLRMCEQQDSLMFNATDADSCGQLLLHVISNLEAAVGASGSSTDDVAAQLSALLHTSLTFQLLHLVLRFGCLWNGTMKAVALRLVKALLELTRQAGERPECGGHFVLLLDSLSLVLDELPPPLLAACVADVEAQLYQANLATPERTDKLQQLSLTLDNATTASGWFMAPSAGAALKRGWFTPGGLNPWECAEYLDAPPAGAATTVAGGAAGARMGALQVHTSANSRAGHASGAAQTRTETSSLPGARMGWPSKLSLNTAIPLSMLGLRVTRDLVPHYASPASPGAGSVGSNQDTGTTNATNATNATSATNATNTTSATNATASSTAAVATVAMAAPTDKLERDDETCNLPVFVESERSYGERVAGEPAFSRDLRRGLLLQPALAVRNAPASNTDAAARAAKQPSGSDAGGARLVGMSSNAIPVIDLTWDEDEAVATPQPAQPRPPPPPPPQPTPQLAQTSGSARVDGGAPWETGNSRKRRLSRRD